MDEFRPPRFSDYIGQTHLKETIKLAIKGANDRGERLEHMLFVGPPGSGKTSLAHIIEAETSIDMEELIAPIKPAVLRRLIMTFTGILFIDEIHRMSVAQQETLLPLLEDQRFFLDNGNFIENDDLVIIGATTERKKIIAPLYDRFTIKPPFDKYSDDEMAAILQAMGKNVGLDIPKDQALILGRAAAGVPRNLKAFVKLAQNLETMSAKKILRQARVTEDGLDVNHLRYLEVLINAGGSVGVEIIATHIDMPKDVVLNLERLLVEKGFIEITKSGRGALKPTYNLLKQKVS